MFFKQIETQLQEGGAIQISIMKKGGELTVISFIGAESIKPLRLVGTAEELDAEYFKILATPIELSKGLKSNVKEVVASITETIKEEAKPKVEKAVAAKAPVKTKTVKELTAEADKLHTEKKYKEAMEAFTKLVEQNPKDEKLKAKLKTSTQWFNATNNADIFADVPDGPVKVVDAPAHKSSAIQAAGKVELAKQDAKQVNVDLETFVEEKEEEKEVEEPTFDDEDQQMIDAVNANGGLDGKSPLFNEQGDIPSLDNEFDLDIPEL
jgi:PRTRC genetic system protein E